MVVYRVFVHQLPQKTADFRKPQQNLIYKSGRLHKSREKKSIGYCLFSWFNDWKLYSYSSQGFNRDSYWLANGLNDTNEDDEAFVSYSPAPLDTFFVKNVTKGGSADEAGLKSGMCFV